MKQVERSELLSLGAYEELRPHFRGRMIAVKERRRLSLGAHMSIVFENHDTVLLQVQEMLRTERLSDERAIAHELETYNALIPPAGGLSATHFIEYDDPTLRTKMLVRFASLRQAIQIRVGDRVAIAKFATHFGEEMDRLAAVNYLMFDLGADQAARLLDPSVPARIEVTHPDYRVEVDMPVALRQELAADLGA
ncbi:MAG TPA: DUF3501 family protein [Polyangiales bacterium]